MAFSYWKLAPVEQEGSIQAIVADLQRRSISPEGRFLEKSEAKHNQWSVEAMWKVELKQDWNEYARWVAGQFSDFTIKGPMDGKVFLSKQLPGDSLRLIIEKLADKPLQVRVSFTGFPF